MNQSKKQILQEIKQNVEENKFLFKELKYKYLLALAINETNLKIEDESKREVLKEHDFFISDKNKKRYPEENHKLCSKDKYLQDYLLNDKDFINFLKLVDIKRREKGLRLNYNKFDWAIKENWNLSSDSESRPLLNNARKNFLKVALKTLPQSMQEEFKPIVENYHYKHTDKFLELALKLDVDV